MFKEFSSMSKKRGIIQYTKLHNGWLSIYTDGYILLKSLLKVKDFLDHKQLPPIEPTTIEKDLKCTMNNWPNCVNIMSHKWVKQDVRLDRILLKHLLDCMTSDVIYLHIDSPVTPVELKGKNERALIMPMKPKRR